VYETTEPAYGSSQRSTSSALPEQSIQVIETPARRMNTDESTDSSLADALADLETASTEFDVNFGTAGGSRPQSMSSKPQSQAELDDVVAMLDEMESAAISNY